MSKYGSVAEQLVMICVWDQQWSVMIIQIYVDTSNNRWHFNVVLSARCSKKVSHQF